jgi:chromosome partitioning protein
MNVLIQNMMWQNCPIAKLDEIEPVKNLQDRKQWSPNQSDQIKKLRRSFISIADRVIQDFI